MPTTMPTPKPQQPKEPATAAQGPAVARAMGRLASWRFLIASGIVFAIFAGVFFGSSAPFSIPNVEEACGAAPLDVRFHSTADEVSEFLTDCGVDGREAYRNLQIADLFYPAVVGLFMASALALTIKHLLPGRRGALVLAAIPLAGSGLDYLENLLVWIALYRYPNPAASNSMLGLASAAKTTTFWAAGVGLLVGVGLLATRAITRRNKPVPGQA